MKKRVKAVLVVVFIVALVSIICSCGVPSAKFYEDILEESSVKYYDDICETYETAKNVPNFDSLIKDELCLLDVYGNDDFVCFQVYILMDDDTQVENYIRKCAKSLKGTCRSEVCDSDYAGTYTHYVIDDLEDTRYISVTVGDSEYYTGESGKYVMEIYYHEWQCIKED